VWLLIGETETSSAYLTDYVLTSEFTLGEALVSTGFSRALEKLSMIFKAVDELFHYPYLSTIGLI